MLKFLSPSNVVIGSVFLSVLEINLACATFNFLYNIVLGNMFLFFLNIILVHARFISPYNVFMCFFMLLKLETRDILHVGHLINGN